MCIVHMHTHTHSHALAECHRHMHMHNHTFSAHPYLRSYWIVQPHTGTVAMGFWCLHDFENQTRTFDEFRVCLFIALNAGSNFLLETWKPNHGTNSGHFSESAWIKKSSSIYLPLKNSQAKAEKMFTHRLRWIKIMHTTVQNGFFFPGLDENSLRFLFSLININVTCFVTRRFAFIPLARRVISDQSINIIYIGTEAAGYTQKTPQNPKCVCLRGIFNFCCYILWGPSKQRYKSTGPLITRDYILFIW